MKKNLSLNRIVKRSLALVAEIVRDFGLMTSFWSHALVVYWCYSYAYPVKWQTIAFASVMYAVSAAAIAMDGFSYSAQPSLAGTPTQYMMFIILAAAGQISVLRFVSRSQHTTTLSHAEALKERRDKAAAGENDLSDDLVMFHERRVLLLNVLFCFLLPSTLAATVWAESWPCAAAWQMVRYLALVYCTEKTWTPLLTPRESQEI